jgi:hypothetical protein
MASKRKQAALAVVETPKMLKLDFGCGPNPRDGFEGVDQYPFDGKVTHVCDIRTAPWPWADGSVSEAHASHFVEHLTAVERCTFMNELYRVLVPGGTCTIIVPHWASNRAYGDPTHQWPPVSEFWFFYLNKDWRAVNAPHTDAQHWPQGYACHFAATWGYSIRPDLLDRNQEYQQFAMSNYKEAASDMIGTLTKA